MRWTTGTHFSAAQHVRQSRRPLALQCSNDEESGHATLHQPQRTGAGLSSMHPQAATNPCGHRQLSLRLPLDCVATVAHWVKSCQVWLLAKAVQRRRLRCACARCSSLPPWLRSCECRRCRPPLRPQHSVSAPDAPTPPAPAAAARTPPVEQSCLRRAAAGALSHAKPVAPTSTSASAAARPPRSRCLCRRSVRFSRSLFGKLAIEECGTVVIHGRPTSDAD